MTEPLWLAAARAFVGDARRVLLVGCKGVPHASEIATPSDLAVTSEIFDLIVWQPRDALRVGLAQLKRQLSPGGQLLVCSDAGRGPEALLRVLLGRRAVPAFTLEALCEALLCSGYVEPRVLREDKRGLVVLARQPAVLGMFDALFTQPEG